MNIGGLTPCFFCERDGGRTMFGKKWPKQVAVAPYLPEQRWPTNPACGTHGLQLTAYSNLVREPLAVVAHRLEAVENSPIMWNEAPPAPTVAATRAFVDAAVSAPIPASAVAVEPDFQSPMETEQKNDHFSGSPLPPMTPEEEAAFDAGISF